MLKILEKVVPLLWPSMALAGIWLVVALVALWYARSTRRPIFLFGGLAGLLLMLGELLSPGRIVYHYLTGHPIPGGTAGKVDLLLGAYKYQIAVEALGAILLLVGLVREVSRARKRATQRSATRGPGAAPAAASSAMAAPQPANAMQQRPPTQPTMQAPNAWQTCPACNTRLSADADFCGNCGEPLTSPDLLPDNQRPTIYQGKGAGA